MPRPLRIEYEDAWYHVMNRGSNFQHIYFTDEHRYIFLNLLNDISRKFHVEIHGYCLMTNHYHLLIRTPLPNLGRAMRYLDGVYTQRFNRLEKRDGSLFRGRYKAILIDEENYLLEASRYIHLNPVTARICKTPDQYVWSSYQDYLGNNQKFLWLHTEYILNIISEQNPYESYQNFVCEGLDDVINLFYSKNQLPPILGSKVFIKKNLTILDDKYKTAVSTDIEKTTQLIDAKIIFSVVLKYFKINQTILTKSTPDKINYPRMATIYLLRNLSHLTHKQIAESLKDINSRGISAILARCEIRLKEDRIFQEHIANLNLLTSNNIEAVGT